MTLFGNLARRMRFPAAPCAVTVSAVCLAATCVCAVELDQAKVGKAKEELRKAATVSNADIARSARQVREYEDARRTIAPVSDPHAIRLVRLTGPLSRHEGFDLNFKIYLAPDLNANATADGSIRIYSGLMTLLTDDELMFVIGHEIGHVVRGHSANRMRVALLTTSIRTAASAPVLNPTAKLADSVVGDLLAALARAQYSQHQEFEADDYGLEFLRATGRATSAGAGALKKLEVQRGGGSGWVLASHPALGKRIQRMTTKA